MSDIKVTIIITTYGAPERLGLAIMSVLRQTYPLLELIIVDDNDENSAHRRSTQNLIASLKKLGYVFSYYCHAKNRNGAAARNTGLLHATGDFIGFLDSDDEYHAERVERLVALLKSAPQNVGGIFTGCEFRRNGKRYHTHSAEGVGQFLVETLSCNFKFSTGSNIFLRKSVYDEVGMFDERFLRHQDYEFLVRVFLKYSLAEIPEVLVIKNNDNLNLPPVEILLGVKRLFLKKYSKLLKSLPKTKKVLVLRSQRLQIAEAAAREKNFQVCWRNVKKVSRLGGFKFLEIARIVLLFLRWT